MDSLHTVFRNLYCASTTFHNLPPYCTPATTTSEKRCPARRGQHLAGRRKPIDQPNRPAG
nr:MAG TPA_asm: hypothetical protein [Bacteriophage sp.]